MKPIRVLFVDDHAVLLDGLTRMLAPETDIEVVACAGSRSEAVRQAAMHEPNVAVVDLVIPGGGLGTIKDLAALNPNIKCIALTVLEDAEHLNAVAAQGGSGYLTKRAAARELIDAIRAVHRGREYWGSPTAARPSSEPDPFIAEPVDLSLREKQVLRLLSRGYTHKEIAARLDISKKSVDTYRLRLQEKLGVRGRAELVRYAIVSGLFGDTSPA